ncbi:hypothetical protein PR048_014127 [Dryococelus australis]|uniref:Uncharacterized protein n=1 Tax=Dryococelus australis TaxID=614101 RepID=A0ABQ9HDM2_9NEOP|nr:hypothetical protein PR048_014127 [Dryococelus australis]
MPLVGNRSIVISITLIDSQDLANKIEVKHLYTEVTFAIRTQFIRHALDDSEPISDLQGNTLRIPYCNARYLQTVGTAMAEWSDCSPLNKTNRVQSPIGSLRNFCKWEPCQTMPLVGGFSLGSPVCATLALRRCSILTSFPLHRLSKPRCDVQPHCWRANRFSDLCALVVTVKQVSEEIWTALNIEVLRRADEGDEVGMKQRRNEMVGETGDARENPPTNGIVQHDFHMRKSGVTRPGIEPGSP